MHILKTPFEQPRRLKISDYRRVRDGAAGQRSRNSYFESRRKVRCAVLHLKAALHFGAIPVRHPLGHKKREHVRWGRGDSLINLDTRQSPTSAAKAILIVQFNGAAKALTHKDTPFGEPSLVQVIKLQLTARGIYQCTNSGDCPGDHGS